MDTERTRETIATRVVMLLVAISVIAVSVGVFLTTKRQWNCRYRFWSNGGRNSNWVPAVLVYAGAGLAAVSGMVSSVLALRSRRPMLFLLAILAAIVVVAWVPAVVRFGADCAGG